MWNPSAGRKPADLPTVAGQAITTTPAAGVLRSAPPPEGFPTQREAPGVALPGSHPGHPYSRSLLPADCRLQVHRDPGTVGRRGVRERPFESCAPTGPAPSKPTHPLFLPVLSPKLGTTS